MTQTKYFNYKLRIYCVQAITPVLDKDFNIGLSTRNFLLNVTNIDLQCVIYLIAGVAITIFRLQVIKYLKFNIKIGFIATFSKDVQCNNLAETIKATTLSVEPNIELNGHSSLVHFANITDEIASLKYTYPSNIF